uniref:Uncharacterized protein n=1 Tax=Glossina austeni TaxID=7395 RepID=A0A1A9UZV0_GLOAU
MLIYYIQKQQQQQQQRWNGLQTSISVKCGTQWTLDPVEGNAINIRFSYMPGFKSTASTLFQLTVLTEIERKLKT